MNPNDFQIVIASINGSGTLTSNRVLHKTLFRHGLNVVGKNLFPSNIEGLPTYYFLRVVKDFQSLKTKNEIYVGLNPQTVSRDAKTLIQSDTLNIFNSDLKIPTEFLNTKPVELSFKDSVSTLQSSVKIKKRISNMTYVGWISKFLNLDLDIVYSVLKNQFHKTEVVEDNFKVIQSGFEMCSYPSLDLRKQTKAFRPKPDQNILIEGNQATAMGWMDGGCHLATWYPITPSTSVVESFESMAKTFRQNNEQRLNVAVLQSEDEISAISSVIGAGWAGARAATATSGPGLSLMSEALGLSYFAEIPAVVCDVQRIGPSTGLPTRTSQGDLEFAYRISHGDTEHPVLLPATPKDCYTFGVLAFDLAEQYQTPVFMLSDLDLGMNLWTDQKWTQSKPSDDRPSILTELDLENMKARSEKFMRYKGDSKGVPQRTLPGTHHPGAAYFTRGSGHNESAGYSEHPEDYEIIMNRLKRKIKNCIQDLPQPLITLENSDIGFIYYGTTSQILPELKHMIQTELKIKVSTCQVQSLPLAESVYDFASKHSKVYVIEQNRDGQLKNIMLSTWPDSIKIKNLESLTHFNGWSIQSDIVFNKFKSSLGRENLL